MAPSFCTHCGHALRRQWLDAEQRERLVCSACGGIHYQNPRILVAGIVEHDGRLLMCKRAVPPSVGGWTPPAGFMELDETLEEAAAREIREETGVVVEPAALDLHMLSSIPWTGEVYVSFRAKVTSPVLSPGPESLDARFFAEDEIPWGELAFKETAGYLKIYLRDRARGAHGVHVTHINASGGYRRHYSIDKVADVFEADLATSRPR
jgi:ADP-ribose pyrophosphatase YjhB (NUDIX family)